MPRRRDSHRFLIRCPLIGKSLHGAHAIGRERLMLDVILLALGFVFFALSIGYAYACDRL
jgi:hypothetical protein